MQNTKKRILIITVSIVLALCVVGIGLTLALTSTPRSQILKVYNWEDYIETSLLKDFEKAYKAETGKKIKVEYHTFTDNEELYTKIKTQKADYDIAFPSEYMVQKMSEEGLINQIDTTKIANYNYNDANTGNLDKNIMDRTQAYDHVADATDRVWSVPYMVGTLGIMYDTDTIAQMADKTGITVAQFEQILADEGFGVLFGAGNTTKFKDHITMKKSARDTIGVAMLYAERAAIANLDPTDTAAYCAELGKILNMQGDYSLNEAKTVLNQQITDMNPVYENDNGKKSFMNTKDHQFAYGLYWSCDAGLVMDKNDAVKFYIPTGTNLWTDNFVMPKYGKNADAAYAFINFMLDPDNAKANIPEVGSGMAIREANAALRAEWDDCEEYYLDSYFPTADQVNHSAVMRNFSAEQETRVNELMIEIMNNAAQMNEDNGGVNWFLIILGVVAAAAIIGGVVYYLTHRRRRA